MITKIRQYFISQLTQKSLWLVFIIIGFIAKLVLFPVETGD